MKADPENGQGDGADEVIDAAFFANILETDLANIVKKATSGLPLTKREREMIEQEQTKLEKKPLPAFNLEGEGASDALGAMTQIDLAAAWGFSVRSIKGWLAEGRAAGDPCPLTKPAEMPDWFARRHAPRQCPEKLRLASQRLALGQTATSDSAMPSAPAQPVERLVIAESEKGMLAMLNRCRDSEAMLHAKYMAAVDAGDEIKSSHYLNEWTKMGEKLRQMEKVAPEALAALGIFVRRDEVQRELEPLLAAVVKGFRQALRRCRTKLKSARDADEWNRLSDEIVSETCGILTESNFVEQLELEAA